MARTIIVDGGEKIACPKCNHGFPLSEGISRQTIERYAEDFERSVAAHRKKLEAELAAEAKAQFEQQRKALNEALSAKEGALAKVPQRGAAAPPLAARAGGGGQEPRRRVPAAPRRGAPAHRGAVQGQIESAQREAADLKRKLEQGLAAAPGRSARAVPRSAAAQRLPARRDRARPQAA